jgi:RNA polymerase sigma-70 factor (sigma-E family)
VEEFEAWVHARGGALARTAYLLTGDVQLAEDLLQETLARVADRWHRLSRSGSPDAYARRVMHHLSIDRWRRRQARPAEVLTDSHHELAWSGVDADAVERRLVLRDALARLTPKQRAVLSLRFYEDLTEVQTAEVLGVSTSTVKSQTRQALDRLRALAPDLLSAFDTEEAVG